MITSGSSAEASERKSSPSRTSPTISMSACSWMLARAPRKSRREVSPIRTRIIGARSEVVGQDSAPHWGDRSPYRFGGPVSGLRLDTSEIRRVRGTNDVVPPARAVQRSVESRLLALFELYGY